MRFVLRAEMFGSESVNRVGSRECAAEKSAAER